jgi:peroxiredoxin
MLDNRRRSAVAAIRQQGHSENAILSVGRAHPVSVTMPSIVTPVPLSNWRSLSLTATNDRNWPVLRCRVDLANARPRFAMVNSSSNLWRTSQAHPRIEHGACAEQAVRYIFYRSMDRRS